MLAVGGDCAGPSTTTEIYDPARGSWSSSRPTSSAHCSTTAATLLADGRVLVVGDTATPASEIYDPTLDFWSATVPEGPRRISHTATGLADGRVLVAAGFDYYDWDAQNPIYFFTAEVYDPSPQPDASTPQVSCPTSDGWWHMHDVAFTCPCQRSAIRAGGPSDAVFGFVLTTNVPDGTETDRADTNTFQVCNTQSGCTLAGPITGNRVDKRPPTIMFTAPVNGAVYERNSRRHRELQLRGWWLGGGLLLRTRP